MSAAGSADASATTGSAHSVSTTDNTVSGRDAEADIDDSSSAPNATLLAAGVRQLLRSVLASNTGVSGEGPSAQQLSARHVAASLSRLPVAVHTARVDDGDCSDGGCALALAVSVGGSATATALPAEPCAGLAGRPQAVAVAMDGIAQADARQGVDGTCAAIINGGVGNSAVSAVAGRTGDALAVSIAKSGSARSAAGSGSLGAVTATSRGTQPRSGQATVAALSGATGDAGGIAVGAHGAQSDAHSGNSGDAKASCLACASARNGLTRATSGATGLSYSLAGAGLDAAASARSGDTGDVTATATNAPPGRPATATQAVTVTSFPGGRVDGRSGDTGDAIAAAADPSTWVHVDTDSGRTGRVASVTRGPREARHVSVGSSHQGTSRVRTGKVDTTSTVSGDAGVAGSGGTTSTTAAVSKTSTQRVLAESALPLQPAIVATPVGYAQRAPAAADTGPSLAAIVGVAGTLLALAGLAVLAALAWMRRGRARR